MRLPGDCPQHTVDELVVLFSGVFFRQLYRFVNDDTVHIVAAVEPHFGHGEAQDGCIYARQTGQRPIFKPGLDQIVHFGAVCVKVCQQRFAIRIDGIFVLLA